MNAAGPQLLTDRTIEIQRRLEAYGSAKARYYCNEHRYTDPPEGPNGCNADILRIATFERYAPKDVRWLLDELRAARGKVE